MIRRDTDYAFRGLVHIAARKEAGATATELAQRQKVPRSFAQKILRKLVIAGILRARSGRGGGFVLARRPARITMMAVIAAIQGRPALNRCLDGGDSCNRRRTCPVSTQLARFQRQLDGFLRSTSLADILNDHDSGPQKRRGRRGRPKFPDDRA